MSDSKLLPGLQNCLEKAYNVVRADFLGADIFTLAYTQGTTVKYGPTLAEQQTYDVPDGVSVQIATATSKSMVSGLLQTTADYDVYFSGSLGGGYADLSWDLSLNSSIAFHGSLFTSSTSAYMLYMGGEQVYAVRLNSPSALTPAFASALASLPATLASQADVDAYFAFFEQYGTHYLAYGSFGGFYTMQTRFEKSLVEESSSVDYAFEVKAAGDKMAGGGQFDAGVAYGGSTFLSQNQQSTSIEIYTNGGTPTRDIDAFFASIYANPILLLQFNAGYTVGFQPLSALITDATRKATFDQALQRYIDSASAGEPMIASPVVQSHDQVYKAAEDGFVTATIQWAKDGDRGTLTAYSDGSVNPATVLGAASMHYYGKSDSKISQASLTMPVRKGDYYNTAYKASSQAPVASTSFVPLNSKSGVAFGARQTIALNTPITAPSDGFVVGVIQCPGNGDRGYLRGQQGSPASSLATIVAASAHYYKDHDDWVPCESFCMPVAQGRAYEVLFKATSEHPKATAYFLPLSGGPLLGALQDRSNNTVYQAEQDGFVLAMIDAGGDDGARGTIAVSVADDAQGLDEVPPRALTSAHYYKDDDRWVPLNSVTVPVARGSFYRAVMTATSKKPAFLLTWVPLAASTSTSSAASVGAIAAPTASTKSAKVSSAGRVQTA